VKSGYSLSVIAQEYGESLNNLMRANNKWSNFIFVGQILNISIKSNPNIQQTVQNKCVATVANQVGLDKMRNEAAISSNSVLEYASNFLGIPYVWGGTSSLGFDCLGFLNEF